MRRWFSLVAGTLFLMTACSPATPSDWSDLIPEKTPFLIVPEENITLEEILDAPYMPFFEDASSSAVQVAGELLEEPGARVPLAAILLYPDTSNDWQPVWVTETVTGMVENLARRFHRPFSQNQYHFKGRTIDMLQVSNRMLFVTQVGSYTLISESSLAIEDMLRTFQGELPAIELTDEQTLPGSFIANTPSLEIWVKQLANISYRPMLANTFTGAGPISMTLTENSTDETLLWKLRGHMMTTDNLSPLIRGISAPSKDFLLDRYISINASAFSIFQLEARTVPPSDIDIAGSLDEHLDSNRQLYRDIAATLDSETAYAAFAESGFMSSSEFLFLRRLEDPAALRTLLNGLVSDNLIESVDGGSYYLHSSLLGKLIGSDLSTFTNFYLAIHGEAAVLSRSNGPVQGVGTEFDRRNVYYYDDHYVGIRENLPAGLSSFTYVNTPLFNSYIQPWLFPQNYFNALSSNLEILTITTTRTGVNDPVEVEFASYAREVTDVPYMERWVLPFSSDLTGTPVMANIAGNPRDEIIFSTTNGTVYVAAVDGSVISQMNTATDRPIGPPVVFDWYGNNQNVVMQAAGNKIYAWNETGALLPSFPVILNEEITTPLQVQDATRNGVAEMIVATADRNIHILNQRGDAISGWPQTTNSVVRTRPVLAPVGGQMSLFAFAENSLHSWTVNGILRAGYPIFIEAQYNGSPVLHNDHVLGSASDGNLYATGPTPLFADSLAASSSGDSLVTQSLNVSNNSLNRSPVLSNEMIRVDGDLVREDLIFTQDSNGSILAFNTNGELRFSQAMGQPGSGDFSPLVMDINTNDRRDVISLAGLGRLYAWDLVSGNRIYDLPTSGMSYPLFHDMNNDGNIEIIAQTREGLRVWTVFR